MAILALFLAFLSFAGAILCLDFGAKEKEPLRGLALLAAFFCILAMVWHLAAAMIFISGAE